MLSNAVALAAGWTHSLALKADGTVVAWGTEISGTPVVLAKGMSNIVAIASGWAYRVGVNRAGEVIDLQTGIRVDGLSNIVAVAVQYGPVPMGVALQANGNVMPFATRGFPSEEARPPMVSNVVAIACGTRFNLALVQPGTVWGWGSNGGWLETGHGLTNVPCFVSGWVQCRGQELTEVTAISACEAFGLALRRDGTIVNWGFEADPRFEIPAGLTNVTAISAGGSFSLAITTNAAVAERFKH